MQARTAIGGGIETHHAVMVLERTAAGDAVFDELVFLVGRDSFHEGRTHQDFHFTRRAHAVAGALAIADALDLGWRENHAQVFMLAQEGKKLFHRIGEFLDDLNALLAHGCLLNAGLDIRRPALCAGRR